MIETQVKLMAQIIDKMLASEPFLACMSYGINVGQCPYCLTIGKVLHLEIVYEHADPCPFTLNDQLQQSLSGQE